MDELIKLIAEKTGLDDTKAKEVVDTVFNFLKEKVPGGAGDQIVNAIEGGASGLAGLAKSLLGDNQ